MDDVVFLLALTTEIVVNHDTNGCSPIYKVYQLPSLPLSIRITLPGNRRCLTFSPLFVSLSTKRSHCVDLPALSRPSKTMSFPRVIVAYQC